jgi:hypothetical protein
MRKLAVMVSVGALMAAPAFATGGSGYPGNPSDPVKPPAPSVPMVTNPEASISVGGGIASVSGGGEPSETSLAGTQSSTSVENGDFSTTSNTYTSTATPDGSADGVTTPGSASYNVSTQDSNGSFQDTAQASEAYGGETGGGTYTATGIEGGVSATESGAFPVNGNFNGF